MSKTTIYQFPFAVFQVQKARGASREGVQQNTTREFRLGSRHVGQRLCFLILAFIRLQLAS